MLLCSHVNTSSDDTEYLVCPFTSGIRFVPDVPYDKAKRILELLNNEGPIFDDIAAQTGLEKWMLLPPEQYQGRKEVRIEPGNLQSDFLDSIRSFGQEVLSSKDGGSSDKLIPGYTTEDDLGKDGDDTLHSEIAFYRVPNCIQAPIGFDIKDDEPKDPESVDVAYNEFIEPWIILALKYLGYEVKQEDTQVYVQKTMTDIITQWIEEHWKPPKSGKCE